VTSSGGAFNQGAVYKIAPSGAETVLYSFGTSLSGHPTGNLVQGTDGDFYGVNYGGGATNNGVVYKITPSGASTLLYSFDSTIEGLDFGLIQGSDGNFYGVTETTAYEITPAGVETVLYSFGPTGAGSVSGTEPNGALVEGRDGDLYGVTYDGGANHLNGSGGSDIFFHGDQGDGTIYKLAADIVGSPSIPVTNTNGMTTFSTSNGTITPRAVAQPGNAPSGYLYPDGWFTYTIQGITPGSTVNVTITTPAGINPTGYIKCGSSCAAYPQTSIGSNAITLKVTDGGMGDADGLANGIITDPGAPAVANASGTSSGSGSDGGAFGLGSLAFLGLAALERRRRIKIH